tara:strand:+ start:2276 stop:2695 length:420 start_codon:yes stop_codon:yes gene_type:complete
MQQVRVNKKLTGLFPDEHWKNPKGHISALVKGGKVVAYAECSLAGTPPYCHRGRSCHSEIALLKYINTDDKRKISKYTIWNIRWSKDGKILNSKPCLDCQKTLIEIGVKTIVFSKEDGNFYKDKLQCLVCTPSSGNRNK